MVGYLEDMVIKKMDSLDIEKGYHLVFERFNRNPEHYTPVGEMEKYEFLKGLDSVQFAVIWKFETALDMLRLEGVTYRKLCNFPVLNIRPISKYMDYLEEVGKSDEIGWHLKKGFV